MASINIEGMDELITRFEKLGNKSFCDEVGKHMVDAAAPMAEASMKGALSSVEHGPYATGSVSASVQTTPSKINSYGAYAVARPTGRDAKGTRNAEKAAYLQYGTNRMAARPWRDKAVNAVKGPALKAMEEVLKQEMELD